MKICPECHKLSKDDDFCSHCGAAVYGENDYSESDKINCDNNRQHSHEKQTFTDNRKGNGPIINGTGYKGRDFTKMRDNTPEKKKKSPLARMIVFLIIIYVLANFGGIFLMLLGMLSPFTGVFTA